MATMVYEYGLLPPTKNADVVWDQVRHAQRYYNTLVEIERGRRVEGRATLQRHAPTIAAIDAEVRALEVQLFDARQLVKRARQAAHPRCGVGGDVGPSIENVKALRARLKELFAQRRAEKAERPVDPALFDDVARGAQAQSRAARAGTPLYWGSYLLVEQAIEAAKKPKQRPGRRPVDPVLEPRFKRFDGTGRVGVHFGNGGLPTQNVFADDGRLIQIKPVPEGTYEQPRGVRRKLIRTTLRLRVDSTGRDPVWAEWPIFLHRPLPPGRVKRAVVILRKHAHQARWRLQLTIDVADAAPRARDRFVGIDIGWRQFNDGLRVAVWRSANDRGELRLPQRLVEAFYKADSIRSFRDRDIDELKKKFAPYLETLPPEHAELAKNFVAWRSAQKFARLALFWRAHRFDGDEAAYDLLEAWRKRDKHLWCYETGMRSHATGQRRELYRRFAKHLVTRFGVAVFEDWDLSKFVEHDQPEDGPETTTRPDRSRVIAALSILRDTCKHTFAREGGVVITAPAEYTTLRCSSCRQIGDWDAALKVEHTCEFCGETWDQDDNAAMNLLAYGPTALETHEALAAQKPKRQARFAKRHKPKPAA